MSTDLKPGVHAAVDPHRPAVIEHPGGAVLTYGDLEERSRRLAGWWYEQGLRPGDHVAVLLDNHASYFVVTWAAQRSGLLLTPVNWHLGPDEARSIIEDCGARVLVSTARLSSLLGAMEDASARVPIRLLVDDVPPDLAGWDRLDDVVVGATPLDPVHETEGSWMFYSSGTTGRPKGIAPAPRDQPYGTGSMLEPLVQGMYGFRAGTTYLCPAPLYHAAPLGWSMATHRIGGTVVLLERFDPAVALDAIGIHRVTHAQFVPTHFVRFLKLDPAVREAADVSSLEAVIHAAAPCPPEVKDAMLEWLGPIVHEYYSGSEGVGFCAIGPEEWRAHRGSVGKALIGTIHVVDAEGNELPPGETGQIWFETPIRFEYHGDPAKTAEAFDHRGWATIGDIGRVDDEGYLYLTDRVAHTVISGGVNIYPREIEDVLVMHPGVTDVAVIGVPDDEMGERLLAVVEAAPGAVPGEELAAELQAHCRAHLAGFKCPREVTFVDELPRLPTGKVRKSDLRRRYGTWSGSAHDGADR